MLETIREYALGQLAQAGELEATRRRHAEYYAEFAEQANGELHGSRQLMWLDRLEIEHDNLRAALSWTLGASPSHHDAGHQRLALGLRMVNALSYFWYTHDVADGRGGWSSPSPRRPVTTPLRRRMPCMALAGCFCNKARTSERRTSWNKTSPYAGGWGTPSGWPRD